MDTYWLWTMQWHPQSSCVVRRLERSQLSRPKKKKKKKGIWDKKDKTTTTKKNSEYILPGTTAEIKKNKKGKPLMIDRAEPRFLEEKTDDQWAKWSWPWQGWMADAYTLPDTLELMDDQCHLIVSIPIMPKQYNHLSDIHKTCHSDLLLIWVFIFTYN